MIPLSSRLDRAYASPAVNSPIPIDPQSLWPVRFWDETIGLLHLFEKHREQDDSVNALACFSRLAQYRYLEMSKRPGYDCKKKSIVSFFQPKSGGTYLQNRLVQLGYQDFWWFFPSRRCHSYCCASSAALELFLLGGCTCHSHGRPDPNILAAFDRAGVEKIWVHLRNPAEAAVSAYHHFLGEGQGEGDLGEERSRLAIKAAAHAGMTPETHKSVFVMDMIGWYLEWIAAWLKFAGRRPDLVVFSYYSEMKDPRGMLSRVLAELGDVLTGDFSAAPSGNDRYRYKTANNWREGLTSTARDYIEQRVKVELQRYPQFAQLWS